MRQGEGTTVWPVAAGIGGSTSRPIVHNRGQLSLACSQSYGRAPISAPSSHQGGTAARWGRGALRIHRHDFSSSGEYPQVSKNPARPWSSTVPFFCVSTCPPCRFLQVFFNVSYFNTFFFVSTAVFVCVLANVCMFVNIASDIPCFHYLVSVLMYAILRLS